MSGVFGYIGENHAVPKIIEGLQFLDYRGYDSAGIATIHNNEILLRKVVGTVPQLKTYIDVSPIEGTIGLGHTRWATHGAPTERNAHPLAYGNTCIVHNGIVENYKEIEAQLRKEGYIFHTDTDSEIIVCLFNKIHQQQKSILKTAQEVLKIIEGPYAILVMFQDQPDKILAAVNGNPLVIGLGENEFFAASDVTAFINSTPNAIFMEDGDIAILSRLGVRMYDSHGNRKESPINKIEFTQTDVEKGGYRKYMLKEIFEQPRVVRNTIAQYISGSDFSDEFRKIKLHRKKLKEINKVLFLACGSTANSAIIGKHIFETFLKVPVDFNLSSEHMYKKSIVDEKTLIIAISQSGETADTVASAKQCKKAGAKILSITNSHENSLSRISDYVMRTQAGPELSVSSTKTFTAALTVLYILAGYFALSKGNMSKKESVELNEKIKKLPDILEKVYGQEEKVEEICSSIASEKAAMISGRGINYAVTLEGALKLQEIAYMYAFGFASGELKHGPIAMIGDNFPVINLLVDGMYYEKMLIDIMEIKSRNSKVIIVTNRAGEKVREIADEIIEIPEVEELFSPLLTTIVLQFIAYYSGFFRKNDIDKPRNIAKSVTV
ncbi:MAG: glutamine--fructose-6-phosphate transaminase (isomerizing) [Nitrospinae bacterium]|nr:glutamine--fructose-6-phosphate transaminase (isomerizing) [Nitrospinota bacterium]